MTQLRDLPQGGQAQDAWSKPPRGNLQRRADVLRKLESDNKLWIATASADGSAHLVPFSFVWDGDRITMATRRENPAAPNAGRTGKARLALGSFADVVLIDGSVNVVAPEDVDDAIAERLSRVSAIDGRKAPGFVYLQLSPRRIQAWWSGAASINHRTGGLRRPRRPNRGKQSALQEDVGFRARRETQVVHETQRHDRRHGKHQRAEDIWHAEVGHLVAPEKNVKPSPSRIDASASRTGARGAAT